MNEEAKEALNESITDSKGKIQLAEDFPLGPKNCALCIKYRSALGCSNECPVKAKTGMNGCEGTPYSKIVKAKKALIEALEEEDDFLRSLREPEPKEEPKPRHIPNVGDWIRMTQDAHGCKNGMAYKVVEVDKTCTYTYGDTLPIKVLSLFGVERWIPYDTFEPWTPRIGERVRVKEELQPCGLTVFGSHKQARGKICTVLGLESDGGVKLEDGDVNLYYDPSWLEPVTEPEKPTTCEAPKPKPPKADRRLIVQARIAQAEAEADNADATLSAEQVDAIFKKHGADKASVEEYLS